MKYKAVIFDLFGTLIELGSMEDHKLVISQLADTLGVPSTGFQPLWFETFEGLLKGDFPSTKASLAHICREAGVVCDEAQLKAGEQVWFDCVKRGFVPRNGAVEVLSEIKNRGYKTGLITDCTAETPAIWPGTPFAQMIDVPLFSCVEGTRKPDPQLYRSACRRLNVQPSDCLYVGDGGSRELTGASRAGMHPVLINSPRDGLQDAHWLDFEDWSGPSISSLRDVLELLK